MLPIDYLTKDIPIAGSPIAGKFSPIAGSPIAGKFSPITGFKSLTGTPIAGSPIAGKFSPIAGFKSLTGTPIAGTPTAGSHCTDTQQENVGWTTNVWPEDLLERIQSVMHMPIRRMEAPKFNFELSTEAAERNYLLLMKKYGGSLEIALKEQRNSPLGMGSEFRPIDVLHTIYGSHPIWDRMVRVLRDGSTWPLEQISEEQRLSDVKEALIFGNHKGALEDPELLVKLVTKDVKYGYAVAFPLSKAPQIPSGS